MTGYYYELFETPLGWMGLLASSKGLRCTTLPQPSPDLCLSLLGAEVYGITRRPEVFVGLKSTLSLYFMGAPVTFADESVDIHDAPPFHRAAWNACRSIPIGETRTYKWLASRVGRPLATRAAGQSMARNRLPIIIPCHRVVASDGSLNGFGGSATRIGLKSHLLKLETAATLRSPKR